MTQSIAEKTNNKFVWVEKYRPTTVKDCILPKRIKKDFTAFVRKKEFTNLLLSGPAGTGKTTIARALCNDLGYDVIVINASDERNIDVVRDRIKTFASTSSMMGNKKAIILDEADGLNTHAQGALRAAMEEFSSTRFILTCNFKNKLIDPLLSRCSVVEFNVKKDEALDMKAEFLKRVFSILENENIPYDSAVVGAVIKQYFPDNRRILNELQKYSINGEIDTGMLVALSNTSTAPLVKALKEADLGAMRKWVEDNADVDTAVLYRSIYDTLYTECSPETVPVMIMITGEYQFKAVHVADQNINTMAFLCELLQQVELKA